MSEQSENPVSLIEQARAKRLARRQQPSFILPEIFSPTSLKIGIPGGPDGYEYHAGTLNGIGMERSFAFRQRVSKELSENWVVDPATNEYVFADDADRAEYYAAFAAYSRIWPVLSADTSQALTWEQVAAWPYEFIEQCYDAAIELNPAFDEKRAAEIMAKRGTAQDETRHEDGTPLTEQEAETSPLG